MTRTGWITIVAATMAALIVGFGAGWFTHGTTVRPSTPAAGPQDTEQPTEPAEPGFEPVTVDLDQTHAFGDGFTIRLTDFDRGMEEGGVDPITGEEGDLPYVSWRVEVSNEGGEPVQTGAATRTCEVGEPLRESGSPALGANVNPPEAVEPGGSDTWDEDCWADEDDTRLQYTVEFHDQDFVPLHPPVTFVGDLE
ncbi:hypothetical protein [Nocardiopsis sp. MG754419]|uniref:hypothetical protein n=1 Tax=Nocardiopsis sp. MG754419 TaxID=2259865 RepID=UPI001BABCF0E|nr:hypothetical protein [Nocardiopsis sp. MG754419]MBR8743216.1 hypothetical protein [Nocardiopsis sp. MG754419]